MDDFVFSLLTNVLLLLGIASIFSIILKKVKDFSILEQIISGLFVGGIMIALMSNSFIISGDIFVDARTIAIAVSGMFLGLIPTLIGGAIGILFRILEGGDFIIGGSLWILSAGLFGVLFKHYAHIYRKKDSHTWYEYLVFATLLQLVMLMIFFLFVPQSRIEGYQPYLIFSFLILFPLAHTFIALFMDFNIKRVKHYYQMISYEKQYRSLFEQNKTVNLLIDPATGQIVDANKAAIDKYGFSYEEFIQKNVADINELTHEEILYEMQRAKKNEKKYFEFIHRTKDGHKMNVEIYSGPVTIEDKEYLYSTIIDVTDKEFQRKMYLDTNEQLRTTLKLVNEAMFVTDEYHNIIIANDKAKEYLDVVELPKNKKIYHLLDVTSKDKTKTFESVIRSLVDSTNAYTSKDPWLLKGEYKTIDISFSISPIINNKFFNGSVIMIRDISKELSHKEQIEYVSYHDYLTGLYNRHFFEAELKRLDTKRQLPLTLFIADVNELKLINDAFGHLEGDELIKNIANIFKKSVRTEDIVARWGGDEFAILLPQTSEAEAGIVYQRIQTLLNRTSYDKFKPSVSIGYATKSSEAIDMTNILNIAEERMYEQKSTMNKKVKKDIIEQILDSLIKDGIIRKESTQRLQETLDIFSSNLQLSSNEKRKLKLLASYHDIGKIAVVKDTLLKTSPLTQSENDQVRSHPTLGSKLLNAVEEYRVISTEVSMTHEHYNGQGYPYGLEGEEIPKLVRIFTIAEAYSVMIEGSNYKAKMSKESALEHLINEAGKQFDPNLVKVFIKAIKNDD